MKFFTAPKRRIFSAKSGKPPWPARNSSPVFPNPFVSGAFPCRSVALTSQKILHQRQFLKSRCPTAPDCAIHQGQFDESKRRKNSHFPRTLCPRRPLPAGGSS